MSKEPVSSQIRPPKGRQFSNTNVVVPGKKYQDNLQKQFEPNTTDNVWEKSKNNRPKYVSLRNTLGTPQFRTIQNAKPIFQKSHSNQPSFRQKIDPNRNGIMNTYDYKMMKADEIV